LREDSRKRIIMREEKRKAKRLSAEMDRWVKGI
jgi:hypothetical protein